MFLQSLTVVLAVGLAVGSTLQIHPASSETPASNPVSAELLAQGKAVFDIACAPCHGLGGSGNGPLSENFRTRPRDLTKGVYKNRSTASGQLPTDDDLDDSITAGIHSSTMPGYARMSPEDRGAVVQYLKTLSPKFLDSTEYPLEVLQPTQPIIPSPQSIARGQAIYLKMQCDACHGKRGKGDGISADVQHDDFGSFVHTTDLTKASDFKFAQSAQDVYRIFSAGMNGVPMPSYASTLQDSDRWHLANYVWSLHSSQ